jgi:uncharacterized Zn finger protein (UPF0148 family)
MDMGMKDSMEKKNTTFKCPSCGEMLSVESKGEADMEHGEEKKEMKSPNTANMPIHQLKNKISSQPNLNSY